MIESDRPGSQAANAAETHVSSNVAGVHRAAFPTTTADRSELLGEISRGRMGVIYRATDTTLACEVAVKVLQDKYAPGSSFRRGPSVNKIRVYATWTRDGLAGGSGTSRIRVANGRSNK
jgi:hypothetical protein